MLKMGGSAVLLYGPVLAFFLNVQAQSLRDAARLDAEGKCDEAERYYLAALAQGSPSPSLPTMPGTTISSVARQPRLRPISKKLLQINPLHPNANLQLARVAAEQKQGKKALEYLSGKRV